jgi:hypothetical protein
MGGLLLAFQVAFTRGCTARTIGGPCGIGSALRHMPSPNPDAGDSIAGTPPTKTRVDGIDHLTVMHGWGLGPTGGGIWNGQPVTVIWLAMVATGCPLTSTCACAGLIVAGAACVHWQPALT